MSTSQAAEFTDVRFYDTEGNPGQLTFRRMTDSSVLRCADLSPPMRTHEGRRLVFWVDGTIAVVSANPDRTELLRAYRDAWFLGLLQRAAGEMRAEMMADFLRLSPAV
ncbi:MAG: hypothetical protein GJU67_03075 [Ferrovum sp.]|jgi:hypothetical protein|nr:hypothetical protein [Ferrovum sp.]